METIIIDGPMHPDLFDGETPIRIEAKPESIYKLYSVEGRIYREESFQEYVAAKTGLEAEQAVLESMESNLCMDDQIEMDPAEEIKAEDLPDEDMADALYREAAGIKEH